jgi:hypothetical protein
LRVVLKSLYTHCMVHPIPPADPEAAPLAETLAAARAHFGGHDWLGSCVGTRAGWLPASALHGGELTGLLERATAATGTARVDIGATLLAESCAWGLAMRAVAVLLFGTRIPALGAGEVQFEFAAADATVTGVAFAGAAYGIAGDARSGDPALTILRDEAALLARLHAELEEHLDPVLTALSVASGRPSRALWRSAGDRLGGAFLWLGEVVGMRERAWDLGARCMAGGGPLAVGAGFRVLEHAGIAEPTRNRRGCCLIYRAAGQTTCFTCPLTTEHERCARLEARAAAVV